MFREGFGAGHHQCGPLLQLPEPLSSLIQGDASSGQFPHHPACCCLHALHSTLSWDVLCQAAGRLTRCCLANYRTRETKGKKACVIIVKVPF